MVIDYQSAATECARYIFDGDCEQLSYQEYIKDSKDPRDHILCHAAVVLGETSEFATNIMDYIKSQEN